MKVRLLAIDLDGTLLTKGKRLHPSSFDSIKAAQDAGIVVVLATGRIRPSMMPFAEQLGLSAGPVICGNGTHTALSPIQDLYQLNLNAEAVQAVTKYAWDGDLHLNVYTHDRLFFLRETPWGDLYRSRVETVEPEALNGNLEGLTCLKVLLVDDPSRIATHSRAILDLVGDNIRATESEPEYLEFMDRRATKGYAVQRLAESLGIQSEEVAVIGDYLNDLEMIAYAGLSGAVGNAHSLVKNAANVVVSSNEEGGVSEFIHRFVLKQQ